MSPMQTNPQSLSTDPIAASAAGPVPIADELLAAVSGGDGVPTVKPGSNRCSDFECKWENAKDFVAWVGRQWDDLWD